MVRLSVLTIATLTPFGVSAFSAPDSSISRREAFATTASTFIGGSAAGLIGVPCAGAVVTDETPKVITRMGGLLERYQDSRGWQIMAPSGWNKFDGEVGAYDAKWQDLVDPTDNIKVSSSPVKSTTTSIDALGAVADVGASLAAKRNAKLINAEERQTEGILFYLFDFALDDGTHQILQLCVNKGKVWSLDANTKEKRYAKKKDMYYNVMGSFLPKL